ncbi:MAG: TlpA family protein disulfide reductase [Ardenticatenaceae bacterium]|nr:TlpA family protein disulfide reductase [Anaerolineales bacterium]MCB8923469.1 TlpA family protein disulfide reductase [Ardenticatenaceae bacterium]MCB8991376.1 TlpA family protein disulfide reductase [Ardenticatenaceae bacterium]MCB9003806.1 TlpA family protein disulfide reductase [Ardenticatenaceae bacterium]
MKRLMILFMLVGLLAACGSNSNDMAHNNMSSSTNNEMMNEDTADTTHDEMMDDSTTNEMASDDMMHEDMASDEAMSDEAMSDDMMDETMSDEMPSDDMMHEDMASDETMSDEAMSDDMMADDMMHAAWQELPLVNARTGETFTLADFSGKTVFVETMATWCTNCRQQLTNVSAARGQLNSDEVVFIALSVETNISAEELATYADNQGFDWLFAVISPDMLQMLADEYGRTIANPPSTPHLIIRADGSTTDLITGIDSAEALVTQLHAEMQ